MDTAQLESIRANMARILLNLRPGTLGEKFLQEFMTPTEQIMLSKRLAIVAMLANGVSSYKIWNLLKVSPSTVARLQSRLESGAFTTMERYIKDKRHRHILRKHLELLLFVISPAMMTKDRGKAFRMIDDLYS
jgi:uncharacterized protein YerC